MVWSAIIFYAHKKAISDITFPALLAAVIFQVNVEIPKFEVGRLFYYSLEVRSMT